MGITVGFATLQFGFNAPGVTTSLTTQSARFSGPIPNLTASIAGDVNHVFSVVSVTSYNIETGASLHGGETVTSTQALQSNGVTPLSVLSGQSINIAVQFACTTATPYSCTATLEVEGTGLDTVSVPLSANVAEVVVDVPAITVTSGKTATATATVTLKAGPSTTATLAIGPNPATPSTSPPAGFLGLSSTSVQVSSGKPGTCTLTVNTSGLAASGVVEGTFEYAVTGTAFNGAYRLEAPIKITIEQPYYVIKSKLGGVISIANASTQKGAALVADSEASSPPSSQLWAFEPAGSGYYYIVSKLDGNVVDIQGASKNRGALLDAFPKKAPAADNQLWYFVSDPQNTNYYRIVSKLNGNAIDVQGNSAATGTPLDAFPIKLTNAQNQQWEVLGGAFPSAAATVPYDPGWGNGNVNYVMDGETEAFANLSAVVNITTDIKSASNGYGFQLNGYSSQGGGGLTVWQQFAIYANPSDGQLHAIIDTWTATAPLQFAQVNNIDAAFMGLPNLTMPAGYRVTIALTYWNAAQAPFEATVLVTGAVFTVTDNTGHVAGTKTLQIIGNTLRTTSQPATVADLSPVTNFTFNIVADYTLSGQPGAVANLTQGAGKITYNASSQAQSGMTVTKAGTPGPGSVFLTSTDTGENANVQYGPLPWPWSPSMTNVGTQFVQLFEALPSGTSTEAWVP